MKYISSLVIALTVVLLTVAGASAVANEKVSTATQTVATFEGNTSDGSSVLSVIASQFEWIGQKEFC